MIFSLRSLVALSVLPLGLACVARPHKSTRGDDVQRMTLSTPLTYGLEDPACQRGNGAEQIGAQDVHMWTGETSAPVRTDLSIDGRESAASSLIAATGFDFHMQTTQKCTIDEASEINCEDKRNQVISDLRDLKLCRPTGTYRRDSIEGITLASIANLERAHGIYKTLGNAKALAKADLVVMPNFEEVMDAEQPSTGRRIRITQSKTDNAGYLNASGKEAYIIFPKSQEMDQRPEWKDVNLWEIPWVMAHEFSHQVFANHYAEYTNDNKVWKHEPKVPFETSGFTLTQETRKVATRDALSAINEGFADMLAFHMLGANENHTKNLPCFDQSRDVNFPTFADGREKSLDREALDIFLGVSEGEDSDDCGQTDFTDGHHVGAIFAYGTTQLFKTRVGETATAKDRSELLMTWIKAFDAARRAGAAPTPEGLLIMAIKTAVDTAKGASASLTEEQCSIVASVFTSHKADVAPSCP